MIWRVLGAIVLLFVAALFSLALTSVRSGHAKGVPARRERLDAASFQLGRTLSAFGFALLSFAPLAEVLGRLLGGSSLAWTLAALVTTVLLALFYVLLALQLPPLLAEARRPGATLPGQPLLRLWGRLSYPLSALVVAVSEGWRQRFGGAHPERQGDALRELLGEAPDVENDQQVKRLLRNVLAFVGAAASDMMTPRPDVVWIPLSAHPGEVLARVRDSGHTRFPLCDGTPDKVIGYLHARDLVFLRPGGAVDLGKLARPVAFVPETARALTLLERFQEERAHMAVVVDEFGGMSGIITLEDILEELVGEIQDEFDVEEAEIRSLEGGDLLVDGGARLDELEAMLGITFGEVEEETLGGYIFGRLAREVRAGDEVGVPGAQLRVEEVDGLRVTRVRIHLTENDRGRRGRADTEPRNDDGEGARTDDQEGVAESLEPTSGP